MTPPLGDQIRASAASDVGRSRSHNEDSCEIFRTHGSTLVAVVADGMGGHAAGALASRLAIDRIRDQLQSDHGELDAESLQRSIADANAAIFERARRDPELRGMGTTIVAMIFTPAGRAWVAHVGDSRAYRLRDARFEQLTRDHSVVARLVEDGVLTEEDARGDPRRNEILRCLGASPTVEIEVSDVLVAPGDRFLLCSDGLTGPLEDEVIASTLAALDPHESPSALINAANEAGGPDNVSVIALQIPSPDEVTDIQPLPTSAQRGTRSSFPFPHPNVSRKDRSRLMRVLAVLILLVSIAFVVSLAILLQDSEVQSWMATPGGSASRQNDADHASP